MAVGMIVEKGMLSEYRTVERDFALMDLKHRFLIAR